MYLNFYSVLLIIFILKLNFWIILASTKIWTGGKIKLYYIDDKYRFVLDQFKQCFFVEYIFIF